jgi:hypothetical protein
MVRAKRAGISSNIALSNSLTSASCEEARGSAFDEGGQREKIIYLRCVGGLCRVQRRMSVRSHSRSAATATDYDGGGEAAAAEEEGDEEEGTF